MHMYCISIYDDSTQGGTEMTNVITYRMSFLIFYYNLEHDLHVHIWTTWSVPDFNSCSFLDDD